MALHAFASARTYPPGAVQAFVLLGAFLLAAAAQDKTAASDQLAAEIDRVVQARIVETEAVAAQRTSDSEFIRRATLDLTGRIPLATEVEAFLSDDAFDKRERLVDQLLQSPAHARHFQQVLDVWLMRRRPFKHVKESEWSSYLFQAVRENKAWDALTREMLGADGAEEKSRAAARFLLDRELKVEETVRDVGRVFLGRDLQCAQCHDHPHFDDYLQRHFHGIAAFINRAYLFTDPTTKKTSLGEKADGEVTFTSVFTAEQGVIAPRILDMPEIFDPPIEDPKQRYYSKPDKKTRGRPLHSRRSLLPSAVTADNNIAFRINIANRLWAMMIGRGIIEPLDMIHADSENAHPELLQLLANDLHEHGYDMRRTIRAIACSETYQRRSKVPPRMLPPIESPDEAARAPLDDSAGYPFAAAHLKPLSPEQLAAAVLTATGVDDRLLQAASAKLPKGKDKPEDAAWELENAFHAARSPEIKAFVKVFASGSETGGFDATAAQALFLRNGDKLTQWLAPNQENLTARMLSHHARGDLDALAREAYLTIFSRPPTPTESQTAAAFVQSFGDAPSVGVQAMARAMICSAAFRLNH